MSWPLLLGVVLALGLALLAALLRRAELRRMRKTVEERERAVRQGADKAQLQHPVVDLSRCLGCGTCVEVCPEEGVLQLVHGQALVVNGARCVGHGRCETECPVGAITVTLADLAERRDVPAVDDALEAVGARDLFLAGEVTAHALIKTAIEHGAAVGAEVARRVQASPGKNGALDLCIVGAGPAGLACALEAKRHGLRFTALDQANGPGGTVAKYPRRKLVMTSPVDMPLAGRLKQTEYTKEELIELWTRLAEEHELPLRYGEEVVSIERNGDGFVVRTKDAEHHARFVCLAMGRRGTPRKLGVPGEELDKVGYSLLDAHAYRGRRVLVVGGGDSAVEAALALAEQPGNEVTVSYRREAFFRIRAQNARRVEEAVAENRLSVLYESEVVEIRPHDVVLDVRGERVTVANDDVFVMAGGTPPFPVLERAGVSFDPALRPRAPALGEQGTGLLQALTIAFGFSVAALCWALWHFDYYTLPAADRPHHFKHPLLRPGRAIGLGLGIAAVAMVGLNLLYLVRRSAKRLRLGSLRLWMTSHVATGILALLCAVLHSAMEVGDSTGGQALWALAALLVTGAVGRYFYAYVPRAANGRELELAEVKARLSRIAQEWDEGQRQFGEHVREEVAALVEKRQWRGNFVSRVLALVFEQRALKKLLRRLAEEGRAQGLSDDQGDETTDLARRAHRAALMAAHYEDLRAILGAWRYLHRWIGVLLVLLLAVHVFYALVYGSFA